MLLPLIQKNPEANDFTCQDGEIEFISHLWVPAIESPSGIGFASPYSTATLIPKGTFPTANFRIPLQQGDKEKANLLLSGDISRVDPAVADRLIEAIVRKAAETLLDLSTDLRRQGLFILPFRFYSMSMLPDGSLSFPSPQAVALPADFPPHPEITAFAATDDALNLAIRFPVRPHMLKVTPSDDLPEGHTLRTFISYPLYIPDPKEMRGSLGSVKSAVGGTSMGIRFSFLSSSSVKASVAAPEKYYEMVGNESTGYRLSSKSAPAPDYSSYASLLGYVAPFPRESLLALGDEVDADTDPMHWIADWVKTPLGDHYEGYLPAALPYCYRSAASGADASWPPGFDKDEILSIAETENLPYILLTRPMALTSDGRSRRNATPRAIRSLQVHGLPDKPAIAILCGSNDCIHWSPIRRSDPRIASLILSPPRFWWRLLLLASEPPVNLALSIQ